MGRGDGEADGADGTRSAGDPARTYEDYFVRFQFRPWARDLVSRAAPMAGERVLDVACGTGVVARMVAGEIDGIGRVVGLDPSPAMLAVARAESAAEGLNIEWVEGSAGAMPFPDASFDLVTIQQGLQFVPDREEALAEVRRVLRPGGRVVSATWLSLEHMPFRAAVAAAIERAAGHPAMARPFSAGDRDTLVALFVSAGFDPVTVERVDRTNHYPDPDRFVELNVMSATAAVPELAMMTATDRAAMITAVRTELVDTIRAATEGNEVVVPQATHIVVARRPG